MSKNAFQARDKVFKLGRATRRSRPSRLYNHVIDLAQLFQQQQMIAMVDSCSFLKDVHHKFSAVSGLWPEIFNVDFEFFEHILHFEHMIGFQTV